MQDVNSRLFDWDNDPYSVQAIISGTAEASELGWPPGVPWPVQFKIAGTKGECVMRLDPCGATRDLQTYLGYYDGNVIRATVYND
jgi:hypothetical protein